MPTEPQSALRNYISALNAIGVLNCGSMEESGELWFLRGYLSRLEKPVLFDVGANIGKYTLQALECCPSLRAFCFEPNLITFAKLELGCRHPNVRHFNFGMGESRSEATLYDHTWTDASSHASLYKEVIEVIHGEGSHSSRPVSLRTLDDVVAELGVDKIDLLKVDTEGHELFVFKGAVESIRKGVIKAIQWEFNEMNVVSRTFFKDFWDLLKDYRFFRLLRQGQLLPIQDYAPKFCEIFAYQNIICLRKNLTL